MESANAKVLQAITLNPQQSDNEIVRKQQKDNTSKGRKNEENYSPNHCCKAVNTKSEKKVSSPSYKAHHNQQIIYNNIINLIQSSKETLNLEYGKIWVMLEGVVLAKNEELIKTVLDLIREFEKSKKISVESDANLALLHFAIRFNSLELAKALLSHGFNINVKDNLGLTPLHYAVNDGNLCAVEFLVSKGADLSAQDKSGKTPLQLAKELEVKCDYSLDKRKEIVALLTNVHSNEQYEQKLLTITNISRSSGEKSESKLNNVKIDNVSTIQKLDLAEVDDYQKVNNEPEHDTISFDRYGEEDVLQNLQFKSQYAKNIATGFVNRSTTTRTSYCQDIANTMETYLSETKYLQDKVVGDISSTSTSHTDLQISNVSGSTSDDNGQIRVAADSKTVSNKQSKKASRIKKAIYITTAVSSPFIAAVIYAAVALSADTIVFNPIIATSIFVGVAILSAVCFAIVKACRKTSEEKGKNSDVGTCTTLINVFTPEYLESSSKELSNLL